MGTNNTTFCLVNFSGHPVQVSVSIDDTDDWDYVTDANKNRPDLNLPGRLASGDARCEREEINSGTSKGCWFTLEFRFGDGSSHRLRVNQLDAKSKHKGDILAAFTGPGAVGPLDVFRATGEDRYVYTQALYLRPRLMPNNSGWMDLLLQSHPNVNLNEITMPGSHDAGMYGGTSEWAFTQHLSIGDQLKAGARYFDLRVYKANDNEIWTYHGTNYGGKLKVILDEVAGFLDIHTRETVFLKFRSYASSDRQDTVDLVTSKLNRAAPNNRLYTSAAINFAQTALSKTAGTAVCAFTPPYKSLYNDSERLSPATGIHPYHDYGNEDTGVSTPPSDNHCLGVYDSYSHNSEFAVMTKDQHQKLADHGGYGKDYLFLLSWTLTGSTDNIMDLDLLSGAANSQLPKALNAIQNPPGGSPVPNIVYIDNVDPWLCSRIIAMNSGIGGPYQGLSGP